jgi:hypothetical protein
MQFSFEAMVMRALVSVYSYACHQVVFVSSVSFELCVSVSSVSL